jgi:hypothetical protein
MHECASSHLPAVDAACSFKMFLPVYPSTWCHVAEYSNLHSHHCENLKMDCVIYLYGSKFNLL